MFLWATFLIWPFSAHHVMAIDWEHIAPATWWQTSYVVLFGTYVGYIFIMVGQHALRPTVVSIYNYVQPLVAVVVSVLLGISVFTPMQALAVLLVFSGVWLVVKSKSRKD